MIVFSSLNLVIFTILGLIHVYWAMGGKWGMGAVFPELESSTVVFEPGMMATLVVAVGLFMFAMVHACALGIISLISPYYLAICLIVIAAVFALRGVGDFKYVGLFKKKRMGLFAKNDTRYYVPLCFLMSMNAAITYSLL